MSETQWFYETRGARVGPFAEQEIKGLVRENKIVRGTLVWCVGMPNWVTIEMSELKYELSTTPPPLASDRVSDLWVWLIALTPLLFCIAQPQFLDACLFIAVLTNSAFCQLDKENLQKAGYNPPSIWWGWGAFVFGYLYLRSRLLGKNQHPLVVWAITLLAPITLAVFQLRDY
ncbi:DUF4339 domain-containing protein [Pseudomonas extremaustralis]|uniref:DUF4339 domain-containing protein n=1 Tax=Pseudomonas extremaustralis TaxID=359110 RepID=UPI00286705B1|nr:DUF4339 domain-containing protein [Pseudomonas extremaustralis]MDR6579271.1 putative membrane-bound dolichyl-phosphate-mannose-protein mannosyltransferase [Pseudomonas extremaustralis]